MVGIIVNMLLSTVVLLTVLSLSKVYLPPKNVYTIFSVYFGFLLLFELPRIHAQLQSPTYLIALIVLSLSLLVLGLILFVTPEPLIEIVAQHTQSWLAIFGYSTELQTGPDYGYLSQLAYTSDGVTYLTYIELACTGLGAVAVIAGVVYLLDISQRDKILLTLLSAGIIYLLNLVRNVFIAISFFSEMFSQVPFIGAESQSDALVSFTIAEVYISQVFSTILLFIILYFLYHKTRVFEKIEEDIQRFVSSVRS
jgi:archaeosortase A (PGF-CTERM-specific)